MLCACIVQAKRRHLCIDHNHHQTIIIIINTALKHQDTTMSLVHKTRLPLALVAAPHHLVWVDSFYLSVVEVLVHDILVVLDVAFVLRCFCIIFCPSCRGDLYGVRHFVVQMVLSSFHACT